MNRWPKPLATNAIKLRKNGLSFNQISKQLKIPKSTLYYWISKIKPPNNHHTAIKKNWIKNIQPLGALANKKEKDDFLKKIQLQATSEIKDLPNSILVQKAILCALYWAEGSKGRSSSLVFTNTDPKLTLLYITLLRKCYKIPENKIWVRLHLHHYHDSAKTIHFWSKLLKIPKKQFMKIYRKKRSKNKRFRQNFGGVCFVGYNNVRLKDEIMAYALATQEFLTNYQCPRSLTDKTRPCGG